MRKFVLAAVTTIFSGAAFAVDGTNLPGRDYANFPAPSAFVCRTSCGGESACQAYTSVKPGAKILQKMMNVYVAEPVIAPLTKAETNSY